MGIVSTVAFFVCVGVLGGAEAAASGNAVAQDTLVGPPRHMQWVAKPLYCRSHEIDTSVCALVSAGGRIFYILDEGLTGITDERLTAMWSLVARDAFNGVLLWKKPAERILPLSLAVEGDRVFFHNYKEIVCLNLKTGAELWRAPNEGGKGGIMGTAATLVVNKEVVLFLGPKKLEAFSAETGKTLWTGPGGKGPGVANPPDLFVADGLVWSGARRVGYDPLTGQLKRTIEVHNLISPGHHFRCYRNLTVQETPYITKLGDKSVGLHLFATAGFLDDSWWNRTFWMYSRRWPGYYIANQAPKSGQLLVFDDSTTYAVKCYTKRNIHSPMFFPGTTGYMLFADAADNEPILFGQPGAPRPVKWLPEVKVPPYDYRGHRFTDRHDNFTYELDKGTGFTRARPPKWAQWAPMRVRAMVLADETLFVAGPPDVLDPDDPMAAFEGRKGALLWAVSAADGKKLAEYKLDSPPVFDGMIAANRRLYLSTRDGNVLCFSRP